MKSVFLCIYETEPFFEYASFYVIKYSKSLILFNPILYSFNFPLNLKLIEYFYLNVFVYKIILTTLKYCINNKYTVILFTFYLRFCLMDCLI